MLRVITSLSCIVQAIRDIKISAKYITTNENDLFEECN
jgi:hypothetical protein